MVKQITLQALVPKTLSGNRLDQAAAQLFSDYSRSRLQDWIRSGQLLVNGRQLRPRDKVFADDLIDVSAELAEESTWSAQPLPLDILFEDEQLLVINKGIDTVVHPAAGHRSGTLLNGLLYHCPQLKLLPRAGIVHRLDKDTSGLLVVAKTLESHTELVKQLQARAMSREYEAVVSGVMTAGGTIAAPLGRHPVLRKKRAVLPEGEGKEAVTHYTVGKRYRGHTHLNVRLETGRTHQIRVHLSHIGYPIVGDRDYAGRARIPRDASETLVAALRQFPRQALHARRLGLVHPVSQETLAWESPLPADMQGLLGALQTDLERQD